jgi:aspartate racemase
VKRIGILAHSAEEVALCFLEACHEGERRLGAHFHPDIVLDIAALGPSMDDWDKHDLVPIAGRLRMSAERLAAAGADFWICPDNTAHMAFEAMTTPMVLPGLHIAEIVADKAVQRGFHKIGITGTLWTMEGPVYPGAFARRKLDYAVPQRADRDAIQAIILDELLHGSVTDRSRLRLAAAVAGLAQLGCDAVVLGCTELPILLDDSTSPLPTLDSTRLLANAAVDVALEERTLPAWRDGSLG